MKRSFLMLIASWIAIASSAATMPNIVVILSDDVGYGDISCNNPQSLIQTPAIDALAKAGRRFTEAHSPAAVCSPTRYGLLTGRYAWRTAMKEGVLYDFDLALIKKGRTTVASLLKSAGYHTAAFGKWHVGLDWTPKEGDPGDWQWGQIVRYNAQVAVSRIDMTKPLRNGPIDLGFDTFYGGLSQGVSRYYVQDDLVTGDKIPRDDMDNVFVAKSEAFLRDHLAKQKGRPFFLYLALGAAHVPLTPPANLKGKSKTGPLGDMVMWVDQSVSRITTLLDELHIADNTLLIFTSDNGSIMHADNAKAGHQPSAGRRGYKTDIWDGGTHVPFIARWPGRIPAGTESHALVCLVDLLATFAAITGQDIPAWHGEDSFNILPALTGDDQTGRSELITHSYTGIFAIRDHEWKMILGTQGSGGHQGITAGWQPNQGGFDRTSATDIGQLYRVNDDPGEKGDLWSQHPDVVKRMRDRVDLLQRQGWSVRPPP